MERCSEHNSLAEDIKKIGLSVARTEETVKNAIQQATDHIQAGAKWRMTIVIASLGLIGTFVSGVVRFSVMEYKVTQIQEEQTSIRQQIYDLNYERGRIAGIEELK
jgi:hypothetical protein